MHETRQKGFTLVELLVVIAIIALLIGLLLPALAKAKANAQSLKDKTQIQQIHKGALVHAADNKNRLPTPGLINTLPDNPSPPGVGSVPGMGPEDKILNTTANLYSAMIAQDYFKPDLCFGTTEINPAITPKIDYNFNAYKPATDTYWDTTFKGTPNVAPPNECNTSYAHLALCGARKKNRWTSNQDSGTPCFGTRGTGGTGIYQYGGAQTGDEYTKSPTLRLHLPKQQWDGHVCFNDNHADTLHNFFHPLVVYMAQNSLNQTKDNIFAAEFTDYNGVPSGSPRASNDAWMGMFSAADSSGNQCTPQWDPLDP